MASDALEYDTKVFTCSVSVPACILIRERLIRIDIRNRFPDFFSDGKVLVLSRKKMIKFPLVDAEEVALNKTWKLLIKNKLSTKLNKEFENSVTCEFSINIVMDYANDKEASGCFCFKPTCAPSELLFLIPGAYSHEKTCS